MIISFLNQKGGVGKTTLAIHIADSLSRKDKKVLLVDADPQASALDWAENSENGNRFSVVGLPKKTLRNELRNIEADYDYIVVDGPPRVHEIAMAAIAASDLIVIPVQPSPFDVWSLKDIVDLVNEVKTINEHLKTVLVINRKIVNTAIGRDVVNALTDYNFPILTTAICQRVAYAESIALGQTVLHTNSDAKASEEIQALTNEILEVI